MPSIQSALMSQPLPLSEAFGGIQSKQKPVSADPQKAATDFESLFSSMVLKEMRKSLEPDSLFGEDSSDIYGGMFDQFLGQHIAEAGGLGIAKVVLESLKHQAGDAKTPSQADSTTPAKADVAKP